MEEAMMTLRGLSPDEGAFDTLRQYDLAIKQHVQALGKLSHDAQVVIAADPVAVLQGLSPAENSLGYLTVLEIAFANVTEPSMQLLDKTLEFLLKFNTCQVRYAGASLTSLLDKVGSGNLYPPMVAVELLVAVILRLDPSGSMFTSTHLALARLACASNMGEQALPVLDADILFYPAISGHKETKQLLCERGLPTSGFLTPATRLTDQVKSATVLEYNLLRGMIYMSTKDWAKALAALEQVISHPSRNKGVSKIMTEAHKKWLLVGLLQQGKTPQAPSYTSPAALAGYAITGEAYATLASLFDTDQVGRLRTEFNANTHVWEEDGNASLVAEVMSAYQKWKIIHLRQIYSRVSISKVRRTTMNGETGEMLDDVEATLALVRDMIGSEMLQGEIQTGDDGEESYLAFGDAQSTLSESSFAREVARSKKSIESLSSQYRRTHERLIANGDYLRHLLREQKRLEIDKDADAAIGFDTQVEDEDLMTGVLAHA